MLSFMPLLLLLGADAPAAAPQAAPQAGKPHVVDPAWAEMPDALLFSRHYPPSAVLLGLPGQVVINCAITAQGAAVDCRVVSEDPPGVGFGEATLAVAAHFRFKPKTVDGRTVGDGRVQIPIKFSVTTSGPDDVKWAARCAGWGQSTYEAMVPPALEIAEWGYVYWRFKFTLHALQTGQKPSQIVERLTRVAEIVGPRRLRSADEYTDCYGEAREMAMSPFKAPPAVTAADLAVAEDCAGLTAAMAEAANPLTPAIRQRYASWASIFVTDSVSLGLKPKEIDRRLEQARLASEKRGGLGEASDAVQACDRASKGRNPLALPARAVAKAG